MQLKSPTSISTMQVDEQVKYRINNAFLSLKLVCDPFVLTVSVENMNKWMATVSNIDDVAFNKLWTYAVFPIQFHLCRHNTRNPVLHSSSLHTMLLCLKTVFTKTSIDSVDQFIQFNKILVEILTENAEAVTLKNLPEDVKYAVIDCLYALHECLTINVIREIYNCAQKFHLLHAHTVYICTQMARNESYVNLRIVSLKCILTIIRIQGHDTAPAIDSKTKANIAETVASILPGLVSMYFHIVSSSAILHRDLYILSARVFGASVALVFESSEATETTEEYGLSKFKSMVLAQKSVSSSINRVQSEEWYKNTAEKLELPAKCLINLCNNSQWKVRMEVADVAKLMLSKCDDCYLMPVLSTLFEVLIILSQDTMERVSKFAQKSLSALLQENTLRRDKFFESCKERLFHLLTSITSAVNSISENILLSQLNLLNGYLIVLNSQKIFKSSVHLENLFVTLTKVVRFDSSTVSAISVNEATGLISYDLDNSCTTKICWRNTKYLSRETELVVKSICHSIGENVDVESLTLYLLDALENQPNNRKEIIYLINNAILNEKSTQCPDRAHLFGCIFNTYVDSAFWSIPIDLNREHHSVSSASVHNNIIQICLLVEGIGNIAVCLKEQFKPLLLHCLYKVVEKAGCTNEVISSTAVNSLKRIAVTCSYPGITELIADNVDYLTNAIAWKLRDLKHNVVVFDVFCVIISFSRENSLSTLLDVMETLLEGNSLLQDAYCEGFLRVFKAFTVKLRSWFSPIFKEDGCSINESNEKYFQFLLGLNALVERLRNQKDHMSLGTAKKDCDINLNDIFRSHKLELADMDEADEEQPADNGADIVNHDALDKEEEKVDPHIEFIISVANKILHALPKTDPSRKALILDILADILLILSDKENQLLPLVHTIWSPLTNRLKYDDGDPLIMRRCFQLLCIMAVTSGDFIRSRTLKDTLPIITGFLSSSAENSKLKDKNSVYRTSQNYKFQLMLLSELGALAVHIGLQEKELHSILVAATPYLSSKQPLPLQDACVELFSTIKSYNEDLVWIYLMSVAPPEMIFLWEHSDQFDEIELLEPENSAEYRKNTFRLLGINR